MKVLLDTSPLGSGHAIRGIGTYTRYLCLALEQIRSIEVKRSSNSEPTFDPDIIHYPYFDLFRTTLPLLKKKPTIITIHDVIPLLFPDFYPTGVKAQLAFKAQLLSLKRTAHVLTDSEASKKDIGKYLNVPENKISVVPLAANPNLVVPNDTKKKEIREKYRLPETYILYVGDINYNKNIPQLIKVLKFLPDNVHLVLVGKNFVQQDIPEWQWIETQIALTDVTERVHFVTDITSDATEDLAALYSQALAYVQPSLYEGFGLPVLEAMQCRVPVVSSNTSSLPEVGGDHAVYAEPTAESLAEKVLEVLAWSKTHRADVIRQAFAWSQTFSWERTARETIKVYKSLLKL